jgi:general secretion pathway protein G
MYICNMWPRGIRRPERNLERGSRDAEKAGTPRTGHEDGFTLIEILVVITIIGLIMSLVGPRVLNYLSESKVKAATIQIQSFASTLDLFYLDLGRYPSTNEGLAALVQRPGGITGWNGPYLKNGYVPPDPWGHPYIYRSPGENGRPYDISSLGSSGKEGGTGTAVAIKSWERR